MDKETERMAKATREELIGEIMAWRDMADYLLKDKTLAIPCPCGCEIIVKYENLPVTCSRCQTKHEVRK